MNQFKKLISAVLSVMLMSGCAVSTASSASSESQQSDSYANGLFDTSYVHTIDIEISTADWEDLLANPTDKTKYQANVTIDGNTVNNVSVATKGNTSLSSVADSDSDRYSLKINFGKYVDHQTYGGIEKLNLNNIYADTTYMKDYISYQIFNAAGSYSVQCSYIWVTVNGEDYGLYLALENVDESWLDSNTDGQGNLYKPETEQLDNVNAGGGMQAPDGMENGEKPSDLPEGMTAPDGENGTMTPPGGNGGQMTPPDGDTGNMPDGEAPSMPGNMEQNGGQGNGMGFGSSDNGASLKYTDDSLESYSDIFDNAETDVSNDDEARVISSLNSLSENEDLEDVLDTDEIISYFAAHNFVMNYDSYTGNMLHNYYLYENDGQLAMIPWDYNLAFGTFMGQGQSESSATSIVNYGIDTPLNGAEESDRPMWSWITANESYLSAYHDTLDQLLTSYFESGDFDAEIDRVYEMIRPYVEKDPSSFYTVEEFDEGYETLKSFCNLRAESIRKQLNGELSTSTSDQDTTAQVDAGDLNISAMGSQGGGKEMPENSRTSDDASDSDL